jgi:DNA-binding NarL/FixJ family response regulator
MLPTATVLIADDHPIVLEGLVALLQGSAHSVVSRCCNGTEVLEALQPNQPDILVLDLNMPAPNALEIARTLKQRRHPATIVLLTSEIADAEIVEAMRLEVAGIVLKETAAHQLLTCLDTVRAGQRWFDPEIARRAMCTAVWQTPAARATERLTQRELDVIRLVARGLRNKEVARELSISEGTVKMYLHTIYEKLNLASRVELANIVREQGLL